MNTSFIAGNSDNAKDYCPRDSSDNKEDTDMKCYRKDYPRPQFVRKNWTNLNGVWDFGFDDGNIGERDQWFLHFPMERKIRSRLPMRRN